MVKRITFSFSRTSLVLLVPLRLKYKAFSGLFWVPRDLIFVQINVREKITNELIIDLVGHVEASEIHRELYDSQSEPRPFTIRPLRPASRTHSSTSLKSG